MDEFVPESRICRVTGVIETSQLDATLVADSLNVILGGRKGNVFAYLG